MALYKETETPYGVTASYHKIAETHINWKEKTASVLVYSYLNQETREQEKQPLLIRTYYFDPPIFPYTFDCNVLATAYQALKNAQRETVEYKTKLDEAGNPVLDENGNPVMEEIKIISKAFPEFDGAEDI